MTQASTFQSTKETKTTELLEPAVSGVASLEDASKSTI